MGSAERGRKEKKKNSRRRKAITAVNRQLLGWGLTNIVWCPNNNYNAQERNGERVAPHGCSMIPQYFHAQFCPPDNKGAPTYILVTRRLRKSM